jgi:hypothetical protein
MLAQTINLSHTTLPDGTELSGDNWEQEFSKWRVEQGVEE